MTRLFHVSDIHLGAEDRAALDWFAEAVRKEQPDLVVMTGDLTMRARSHEFEAAGAYLERLGVPMTIEPGNHDLPYFNPLARFLWPYRRYSRVAEAIEKPIEIAGVTIVPLRTTARFQWRWNWSKGQVSRSSLAEALRLIEAAPKGGTTLVACHHPLIEPGTMGTARTRGGRRALAALGAAGADAVLSGHVHDAFDISREVEGRTVRLIGAGTLSARVRQTRASFNELRFADGELTVRSREMPARQGNGPAAPC